MNYQKKSASYRCTNLQLSCNKWPTLKCFALEILKLHLPANPFITSPGGCIMRECVRKVASSWLIAEMHGQQNVKICVPVVSHAAGVRMEPAIVAKRYVVKRWGGGRIPLSLRASSSVSKTSC